MRVPLPQTRRGRLAIVAVVVWVIVGLIIWRGPDLSLVADAFRAVSWWWVIAAVVINLASVAVRASAWRIVIKQALKPPWPQWRVVFSAFCVGLLGNAVLPGRVGELARVAVVTRHIRRRPGTRGRSGKPERPPRPRKAAPSSQGAGRRARRRPERDGRAR